MGDMDHHTDNIDQVLVRLRDLGVRIQLNDDQISYTADKSANVEEIVSFLRMHKSLIVEYLKRTQTTEWRKIIDPPVVEEDLTPSQMALWRQYQIDTNKSTNNLHVITNFEGPVNYDLLKRCMKDVALSHDSFKLEFVSTEGGPRQTLVENFVFDFEIVFVEDLRGMTSFEVIQQRCAELILHEFNLDKAPLSRFVLFVVRDQHSTLVELYHHIIADGWSINLLHQQVSDLYLSRSRDPTTSVGGGSSYLRYAANENANFKHGIYQEHIDRWASRLEGKKRTIRLPDSFIGNAREKNTVGESDKSAIGSELFSLLLNKSKEDNYSLPSMFLAAYMIILRRYSMDEDICVGVPHANRLLPETADVFGYFVNMLPVLTTIPGEATCDQVLNEIAQEMRIAQGGQNVSPTQIISALRTSDKALAEALFSVAFVYQNEPLLPIFLEGVEATIQPTRGAYARFDLSLIVKPGKENCSIEFEYSALKVAPWLVNNLRESLIHILSVFILAPDTPIMAGGFNTQIGRGHA